MLTIQLTSRLNIEIDPVDWPEIGNAEWTDQQNGGIVIARVVVRRHADGRTVMCIDANPGEGPLVRGDLLPLELNDIEDAVGRFGELHGMPNWVVAKCIQSIRG